MDKISITVRDAVYVLAMVLSVSAVYFKMDNKISQMQKDVDSHSKSFEIYRPAVFQFQLSTIQEDIKEIKDLLKEQQDGQ